MIFTLNEYKTEVFFDRKIPDFSKIAGNLGINGSTDTLVIADENTSPIADKMCAGTGLPRCILKYGEENKNWQAVEAILKAAKAAGLGRDSCFIGVGGGVIGDLTGFASSVYMRGCSLALVSTTLLAMVDASVGGKTGFDLFGVKNLAGSFYPAKSVFISLDCLASLPEGEWKSGMAELIKTAVLDGDDFLDALAEISKSGFADTGKLLSGDALGKLIERAVKYKGAVVSEDFREAGKRMLLNLGHTFAHALESAAGLGNISHGEAVAWGIIRACELGVKLGITPRARALKISELIASFGYELSCPHPAARNHEALFNFMKSDKKKKNGKLTFVIPDDKSARIVTLNSENEEELTENILKGEINL